MILPTAVRGLRTVLPVPSFECIVRVVYKFYGMIPWDS